jgi:hypothetical protein
MCTPSLSVDSMLHLAEALAKGWGPVPDSDAFCRYLIEVANVSLHSHIPP